jgi:hypothetical protein
MIYIFPMFDSNPVQNVFFYQTGGSIFPVKSTLIMLVTFSYVTKRDNTSFETAKCLDLVINANV